MKKKIKKIPKYGLGVEAANAEENNKLNPLFNKDTVNNLATAVGNAASGVSQAFGIEQGKVAQIGNAAGDIVSTINPLVGAGIKLIASTAGSTGGVDWNTGEITNPSGWIGAIAGNKGKLRRLANIAKNSIMAREQTENLKTDYYNNVNVPGSINMLAAEGAIVDNTLKVLVSPDELIYDYKNKTLTKVPFGNGKPNTDDNVFMEVKDGEKKAVINNKKEMATTVDGKTLAKRFAPMIDKPGKKFSQGTIDARDAVIRKALKIQEANKTKPQEYTMYDEGTDEAGIKKLVGKSRKRGAIVAQTEVDGKTYVKLGDGNWYDTINGKVGKRTIKTSKLRKAFEQADAEFQRNAAESVTKTKNITIPNDGYTQNWESDVLKTPLAQPLFGQNKKYNLFEPLGIVERAGYNYGPTFAEYDPDLSIIDVVSTLSNPNDYRAVQYNKDFGASNKPVTINKKSKSDSYNPETIDLSRDVTIPEKLKSLPIERVAGLMDTYDKDVDSAYRSLRNRKIGEKLKNISSNLFKYLPLIGVTLNRPKYHTEEPIISPAYYIPTAVNTDPIRRAIEESGAIARYNIANINSSTGTNLAHNTKLAVDRAKQLADMYQWQQEQQNKLIAQNVGIRNDWGKRYDVARYQAIADTRANEAAADAQYAVNKRDAFKYLRDQQLLPFYKQYLRSGAYNENIENLS